jgi:hypothetical protein
MSERRTEMEYVLERREPVDVEGKLDGWFEIARVTVPPKTRRRVAFKRALAAAESLRIPKDGSVMRLLAAEDAEGRTVREKQREPELEIE